MKIDCSYDALVDIAELIPNPKNNNRHSIEQIKRLSKIIAYQGMRSPIVVSTRSGFIIKGHCRLLALGILDWEKAPVDYQDYESEAQEYADMTADNEIARWAILDNAELRFNIPDLGEEFDLELLGVENLSLADFGAMDVPTNDGETKADKCLLEVQLPNELELDDLYDDLISKGFMVKKK